MGLLPRRCPDGAGVTARRDRHNVETSDSTAVPIFGCGGTLAGNPQLCAALDAADAGEITAQQQNPANFT